MCEADIDIRLLHYYLNSTTEVNKQFQENLDTNIKSDNTLDRTDFASSVLIGQDKKEEKGVTETNFNDIFQK